MPPTSKGQGGVWLVLDLTAEHAGTEASRDLAALADQVTGLTVAAGPALRAALSGRADRPASNAALVEPASPAALLHRAALAAPPEVTVLAWGDEGLLDTRGQALLGAACARLDQTSAQRCGAVACATPVADAVREIDERGNLVGCVERAGLYALEAPLVLRRAVARALEPADRGVAVGTDAGARGAAGLDGLLARLEQAGHAVQVLDRSAPGATSADRGGER